MKSHKDLDVWKKSMNLVTEIYRVTKNFPKEETYGLTNQVKRCVVSIPSNIAEGAGRNSKKEFVQFLYVALGSVSELETQLIIALNLAYLRDIKQFLYQIESIKKMLNGLINHLKSKSITIH
ncbi:MAG: four helix bundle protein [Nitrospirae bacterium]|nr:four helix bundle protein [Nitrospirota bacterium]